MNARTLFGCLIVLPLVFAAPALAQVADPRVAQLEEQVRRLSGTLEELNFQILQMQDQLRRLQEDYEFRFQELEQGGRGSAAPAGQRSSVTPPAGNGDVASVIEQNGQPPAAGSGELGAPPRDFGTIVFDGQGNVLQARPIEQPAPDTSLPGVSLPSAPTLPQDRTTVAALPTGSDAESLYRNSYEFILSGDYPTAEAGFRQFLDRYPGDANEADARFWLGEALLAQNRNRDAAEIFLAASRDFPESRKAPEMLFKLGTALAAMNQRDVACATFAEVSRRYPQASDTLMTRVREGQAAASC